MPVLSAIGMWLVHYYVFAFSTSLPGEVEGWRGCLSLTTTLDCWTFVVI
jgi:hypothetical protein